MSETSSTPAEQSQRGAGPSGAPRSLPGWQTPLVLFVLTLISTTFVATRPGEGMFAGLAFSLPLMLILVLHELGHYLAARYHRVPASLPYFIPMPFFIVGTMGAVILMPERIRSKNALFDIAAAGPLAGMLAAVPVLVYGIAQSEVGPLPEEPHLLEGHSLLYAGLLTLIKGPLPDGHDIQLTRTAFAGWVGLLVTMINLIPAAQLDGGHIAHALLGNERHERFSRGMRYALIPLAAVVGLFYALPAVAQGGSGSAVWYAVQPAIAWLVWFGLLYFVVRATGREHPPSDPEPLSPGRRRLAVFTLLLFAALFTPAWLRFVDPTA